MVATRFVARHIWWAMLWFMRRPLIKRTQRWAFDLGNPGPSKRRDHFIAQERFARKYGLDILTWLLNILVVAVFCAFAYVWSVNMSLEGGLLRGPVSQNTP